MDSDKDGVNDANDECGATLIENSIASKDRGNKVDGGGCTAAQRVKLLQPQ
ncbi:MAG: hypothetical protein ACI9Y1_002435 [Lentisphaeria bacterium]|jgi:hypothetical protein